MSQRRPKTKLLQHRRMLKGRIKTKHLHPRGMLPELPAEAPTLSPPIPGRAAVTLTTAISLLGLITAAAILLTLGG